MRSYVAILSFFLLAESASAFLPHPTTSFVGTTRSTRGVTTADDDLKQGSRPFGVVLTPAQARRLDGKLAMAAGDAQPSGCKIIIAGAPASGKGTQCEVIKEKYGVVHLSTGDMLRAAVAGGTEVGKLAKDYMDSGKLVPDEVIIGVVSLCLDSSSCCASRRRYTCDKRVCGCRDCCSWLYFFHLS
jgi:hypothetical protein